jgi:hypothetical protein
MVQKVRFDKMQGGQISNAGNNASHNNDATNPDASIGKLNQNKTRQDTWEASNVGRPYRIAVQLMSQDS